jgi:hypothetical protein
VSIGKIKCGCSIVFRFKLSQQTVGQHWNKFRAFLSQPRV